MSGKFAEDFLHFKLYLVRRCVLRLGNPPPRGPMKTMLFVEVLGPAFPYIHSTIKRIKMECCENYLLKDQDQRLSCLQKFSCSIFAAVAYTHLRRFLKVLACKHTSLKY